MRKKWIKHHIRQQVRRIAYAVSLSGDEFKDNFFTVVFCMPPSKLEAALAVGLLRSPATARIVPFASYIAFLALVPLLQKMLPGCDSRWFYAVQIGAVMVALAVFSRSYVELFAGGRFGRATGRWRLASVSLFSSPGSTSICLGLRWAKYWTRRRALLPRVPMARSIGR